MELSTSARHWSSREVTNKHLALFARQNCASAKVILSHLDKNVGLNAKRIASHVFTVIYLYTLMP
eukprot:scaffold27070_cov147-Skeletonema_menzelii.AAC.11